MSLPPNSFHVATASKVEHAASFWSRLQTAAAPGALILAALSLTPVGPRLGSAAVGALNALRGGDVRVAMTPPAPAPPGLDARVELAPPPLPAEPPERSAVWSAGLVAVGRLLGALPGGEEMLAAPPGGAAPVDVDPPSLPPELPPFPGPGELPVVPELPDALADLGAPSVEDIGRIAEAVVAGLPPAVGGPVAGAVSAVGAPAGGVVDAVDDVLADALEDTPLGGLVEEVLPQEVAAPALDLLSGLVPSDFAPALAQPAGALGAAAQPVLAALPAAGAADALLADPAGAVDEVLSDPADALGGVTEGLADGVGDALGDGVGDALGDTLGELGDGLLGDGLLDEGLLGDGLGDALLDDGGLVDGVGDVLAPGGDLLGGLL